MPFKRLFKANITFLMSYKIKHTHSVAFRLKCFTNIQQNVRFVKGFLLSKYHAATAWPLLKYDYK